jgi:hypothetical protein
MARSPLFDLYDPYGLLNGQEGIPNDDPTLADLMPQEEKSSMLRSLAEAGTSGLAMAGHVLDTPGAWVRGLLAGDPFSEERISGRDLNRRYGLAGRKDNWLNFFGGLATEIVTDPLTYLNPLAILGKGALNPTGRAVRDTGLLRHAATDAYRGFTPDAAQAFLGGQAREAGQGIRSYYRTQTPRQLIAEAADPADALQRFQQQATRFGADPDNLDAPIAGLMDFRVPGTNLGFNIRGGQLGDTLAEGLDALGEGAKRNPITGPIVSGAAALFHKPSGEVLDPDLQWASRIARADNQRLDEALLRDRTRLQRRALQADVPDMSPMGAIPDDLRQYQSTRFQNALADFVESPGDLLGAGQFGPMQKTSGDQMADWVMENVPEFRDIRDNFTNLGDRARQIAEAQGRAGPNWRSRDHGTNWFPRQLKWWEQDAPPVRPNASPYTEKPWSQGELVLGTEDNFGRSRQPYTDIEGGRRTFRALTGNGPLPAGGTFDSAGFQQNLLNADARQSRNLIDDAFTQLGLELPPGQPRLRTRARPYSGEAERIMASPAYLAADPAGRMALLRPAVRTIRQNKGDLAELLRSLDTQFAANNAGAFDTPAWQNALNYELGQNRVRANTDQVINQLLNGVQNVSARNVVGGAVVPLEEAARRLNFDPDNFRQMWQARTGRDVANFSVPERLLDSLKTLATPSRASLPEKGLLGALDQFTAAFKGGALASPAFNVRNTYSGQINAATHGAFNPMDWLAGLRASWGDYAGIASQLDNAPGFVGMSPQERINTFLDMTGGHRIGSGNLVDDVSNIPEQSIKGMYTGANTGEGLLDRMLPANRRGILNRASDFFSMRGVGITRNPLNRNTNPLLVLNDAVGNSVEDALRTGTFLNQVRKGVDPGQAADLTRMSQVDYSPSAFTSFERNVMKRAVPFYSFQKGILPSIANNLLYQPGGLQGQLIRTVTRGSEPSEENFVPEHLRQSAAIPLPADFPLQPKDGLTRYVTNIDLPFESTFNMFTPGVGATPISRVMDSIQKTGMNFAGQLNPLAKYLIESTTNRQLYSGRQLSDLYSTLEQDIGPIGRPLENAITNLVPFGSRALGTMRQLRDERLDPVDRYSKAAINLLAGFKLTDVDSERTKQLAARDMLNKLLSTTPGVRTYENLTVPEDVVRAMPKEQRDMYLLYKIIQTEAAKRAREKKKAQASMDPMQMLGVTPQF